MKAVDKVDFSGPEARETTISNKRKYQAPRVTRTALSTVISGASGKVAEAGGGKRPAG